MNPRTALIALALLGAPFQAPGQNAPTLAELMARIAAGREATDFRASGRLVRVAADGQRSSYQIAIRAKWFADGTKIFCEVTNPAPARVRLLLESRAAGRSTLREGHAGGRAPAEVPFEHWGAPLLGTGFSYEDLMEDHFLWRKQTLVGATRYGARLCDVIRSEPGPDGRSHYSSVITWLDRDTGHPVRVEKVGKASGEVKEFIYYGLRRSKGIWSASQIEVKTRGKGGSSLLIITRGAAKTNLTAKEFDQILLIKQ
jgi:hypothetical protein